MKVWNDRVVAKPQGKMTKEFDLSYLVSWTDWGLVRKLRVSEDRMSMEAGSW